jgi:hypothetical protein
MSSFEDMVKATPEIHYCYQRGLQALGINSLKIDPKNTRLCQGSVFLEECVLHKYHNENLWDYLLAYDGEVYFVEVHPAQTSEVETVLRKLEWLKKWLSEKAEEINSSKAVQPYYWIASGKFAILPNSPQYRKIIQKGLKPLSLLKLG